MNSIPFIYWGGSPFSLISHSPSISGEDIKAVQDYRRWLTSNDPSFEKLLRSQEKSWIDFPLRQLEMRVFLTSALYEERGSRPIWYYFALCLKEEDWKTIGSHRKLCRALENRFPKGWAGPGGGIESTSDTNGGIELDLSIAPNEGDSAYYKSLCDMEKEFNFADSIVFSTCKIAMNPSMLPDDEGWIVKNTTDRRIPISPEKQKQLRKQAMAQEEMEKRQEEIREEVQEEIHETVNEKSVPSWGIWGIIIVALFVLGGCIFAIYKLKSDRADISQSDGILSMRTQLNNSSNDISGGAELSTSADLTAEQEGDL